MLWQPGMDPGAVAGLAGTRTYPLNSSFRPSYNMAVNLTGRVGRTRAAALLESSFAQFQADRGVVGLARRLRRLREQADDLARQVNCDRGDFMEYAEMRSRLTEAERGTSRSRASAQRAEARRVLATLRRGDIIRVPTGRRAGLAVVLNPPPAGDEFSPNRADGPLVLTIGGQLKQLSAADFPVPADPVDRLRIPQSFSERSPKHRRDLVSAMRSKVAGREQDPSPRRRRSRGGAGDEYPERGRGSAHYEDDFGEGASGTRDGAGDERDGDGRADGTAAPATAVTNPGATGPPATGTSPSCAAGSAGIRVTRAPTASSTPGTPSATSARSGKPTSLSARSRGAAT